MAFITMKLFAALIFVLSLSFTATSAFSFPENLTPANPPSLGPDFLNVTFFNHAVLHSNNPYVKNPPIHTFENLSKNRNKKFLKMLNAFRSSRGRQKEEFPAKVREFFNGSNKKVVNETVSCKIRFFMTWIAPFGSFNDRAIHSIESIFKTNPNACVLIVSTSLDSIKGNLILKPFVEKGFRVAVVSPDFRFLFKGTMAETWFLRLIRGHVNSGAIALGQNISNLLRLCLLYKYGGVYVDTDVIVLKSFSKVKNAIGAQTIDPNSKNWSRLNNAVLVFDKMHPLLYKFIEEFALTFNGNKWGHNGPYLVSRVVLRLQGRPGYNFTILPPVTFYPVNWDKVRVLFHGARNKSESKWLKMKYDQIHNQSYTVHLWNKQSRGFRIKDGSIVQKMFSVHCVFCNTTSHSENIVSTIE